MAEMKPQWITPESTKEQVVEWLSKYDGGVFDISALYVCNGKMLFGFSEKQLANFYKNEVLGAALFNTLHPVQPGLQGVQPGLQGPASQTGLDPKMRDFIRDEIQREVRKKQKTPGSTNYTEFGQVILQKGTLVSFENFNLEEYTSDWPFWNLDSNVPGSNRQYEVIQRYFTSFLSAIKLEHLTFVDSHGHPTIGTKKPDLLWYHANREQNESNIVVVGELKSFKELKEDASWGQLGRYLHRVILSSPHRTVCYGFLTDCNTIAFVKTSFSETEEYTYEVTDFVPFFKNGGNQLLSLLHSHPSVLGWSLPTFTTSKRTYVVSKNLGKGLTSQVWESENLAIKRILHKFEPQMANEHRILELFHSLKTPRVPQVVDFGPDFLVMTPCGENFIKFSRNSIQDLIQTLQIIHQNGFIHRDIRPSNLIQVNEDVYLIDWGFACKIGDKVKFVGKLEYAAKDILTNPEFPWLTARASQDLHMLLKMFYIHFVAPYPLFKDTKDKNQILEKWEELCPEKCFLRNGFQLCSNLDYLGLTQFLQENYVFAF
eukprot:TRINITY_DN7706_c1_g1_i1.p1 TRINITY_DN7706_c1_g1~~TRINITY_DN7706_c1_g1_i1.p1  ORF type:complete len:543 (+),score=88.42 TRINITY_DN7706_c1_g1_i1:50-1678(+)